MRSKIIAVALALSTLGISLAAVPAFADQTKTAPNFPIAAAQFQQHISARQVKAREHMEARAAKLPANEAQALRAKFDERIAKENVEVAKAVADGTVTKDEAKAVREASPHGSHCEKNRGA